MNDHVTIPWGDETSLIMVVNPSTPWHASSGTTIPIDEPFTARGPTYLLLSSCPPVGTLMRLSLEQVTKAPLVGAVAMRVSDPQGVLLDVELSPEQPEAWLLVAGPREVAQVTEDSVWTLDGDPGGTEHSLSSHRAWLADLERRVDAGELVREDRILSLGKRAIDPDAEAGGLAMSSSTDPQER